MSTLAAPATPDRSAPQGADRLSPTDLGELLAAFNEVTTRLQATHESLRSEVARLEGELRDANEQLRRSERLAALGEMAAGIAHEVRNPLGSIRLYAEMLQQDLADRPAQRDVARKIGGAVRGLDAVVGDVLTFARPMRPRAEEATVAELFDAALDCCRPEIDRAGASIEREPQREALAIRCDAPLIRQALVNLVRNALEAVEHRAAEQPAHAGRVWLGAARRRVRGADGRLISMTALTVRDNGPGIPEDAMSRIFNPFFTTRAAGTGLGLAIVNRIADAHGGRVGVSNHPAGGALIELLLPPEQPEESNA
ncbi:MAG: hypothetical protein IBJ10_03180 [Phycisphaerales bacterium]|nr:hypothetical protein [Phycisphaerales bacterium]